MVEITTNIFAVYIFACFLFTNKSYTYLSIFQTMALHFRASDAKELTRQEETTGPTYRVNNHSRMFDIQQGTSLFEGKTSDLRHCNQVKKGKNQGQNEFVIFCQYIFLNHVQSYLLCYITYNCSIIPKNKGCPIFDLS